MASLQELLSKGANQKTKSAVAQAENAIEIMRKSGYIPQAEEFEGRIRNSIVNKNGEAFGGTLKQLYAFQKKAPIATPETDKKEIAPEEAITQIENALNIGDERGIKLSDQDIKSAAFAYGKGDLKKAAKIANKLVEGIGTAIKLQEEEEKEIRTAEGIQVAIGKKTGTVYKGGVPVSRGRENTGSFNSFLAQQGVREEMIPSNVIGGEAQQSPMVSELETVQPQPELYAQTTKPEGETGVPKATQYIVKARELLMEGKVQDAIDILNGTNLPSVYGPIDKSNINDILGFRPSEVSPTQTTKTLAPTSQTPKPNQTSKGTPFQILQD